MYTNSLHIILYILICKFVTFGYEFASMIQIVVHQFVCKTTAKKLLKSEKKGSPLIPRYVKNTLKWY
jgi:hypothetical protein